MEYWCGITRQCGQGYLSSAWRKPRPSRRISSPSTGTPYTARRRAVLKQAARSAVPQAASKACKSLRIGRCKTLTLCCLTNPAASCLRFFLRTGWTTEEDLSTSSTTLLAQKAVVAQTATTRLVASRAAKYMRE